MTTGLGKPGIFLCAARQMLARLSPISSTTSLSGTKSFRVIVGSRPHRDAIGCRASPAREPGRAERQILDLNPPLRTEFALGRAERVEWSASDGRSWTGVLFYPVGYQNGRRHPLAIQIRGRLPINEFSLYGPSGSASGLGPGNPGFCAQALTNQGVAVSQVADSGTPRTAPLEEPSAHARAYEAAAAHFVEAGLAQRDRIGLMGFSRGG